MGRKQEFSDRNQKQKTELFCSWQMSGSPFQPLVRVRQTCIVDGEGEEGAVAGDGVGALGLDGAGEAEAYQPPELHHQHQHQSTIPQKNTKTANTI